MAVSDNVYRVLEGLGFPGGREAGSLLSTLDSDIDTLQSDVDTLQTDVDALEAEVDALTVRRGTIRYVDSSVAASGAGTSWATAFKTIAEAVTAASAGDYLVMRGSFTESVTVTKASLTFIGQGTSPRDACYWNPMAGNDKVNLTLNAAYTRIENIYFRPGPQSASVSACISLGTTASYTTIRNCRFQGSASAYYGIYSAAVGADNVHIVGNEFRYFNTATYGSAIYGINAGGVQYSGWHIEGNVFNSCVVALSLSGRACLVAGNVFQKGGITAAAATNAAVMTTGINLAGTDATNSGGNTVTRNTLDGAYTTALYTPGTTGDCWYGNFAAITTTTAPYGLSVANPAAP